MRFTSDKNIKRIKKYKHKLKRKVFSRKFTVGYKPYLLPRKLDGSKPLKNNYAVQNLLHKLHNINVASRSIPTDVLVYIQPIAELSNNLDTRTPREGSVITRILVSSYHRVEPELEVITREIGDNLNFAKKKLSILSGDDHIILQSNISYLTSLTLNVLLVLDTIKRM